MGWMDYAIASVVVFNVLFLLLCTYMAWRMLVHMRDSQADLAAFANSLKAHAGRLNRTADNTLEMFGDMKRELAKMLEGVRGAGSSASQGNGGADNPGGRNDSRRDPYQQWASRDPKALNRLIDQQGEMLDEISKVDARQFDEWRRLKQVELDRLLQQKQHVQQEFVRLKQSHDEAVHKLREQELRGRAHQRAAAEAGTLRGELSAVKLQLQQAQARAFAAEQLAQAAQDAGGSSSSDNERANAPPPARIKELTTQLAEAEADRQRLRRQLEQIQDNLKRTLTEKEFIEDRFLQLDADRPGNNNSNAASAPADSETPATSDAPAEESSTMVILPS